MSNELTRSVYGTYEYFNVACVFRCKYKCYRFLKDIMKPFVLTNSPDRMQSMESHIRTSVPCRESEKKNEN
jgi:hypothetical protein